MNTGAIALLQKHFDLALDAPDGIKKLRELILTLAMQGKLVPQDPKDQSASELLKEIEAEKRRLVKEGKIRERGESSREGAKAQSEIKPEDVPYAAPKGWKWVRLCQILQFINGDRGINYPSKDKLSNTGIPFIGAINLKSGTVASENLLCVSQEQYDKLGGGKLKRNDLVFCIRGSLGKKAIYPFETGAIASSLVILRQYLIDPIQLYFLDKYLSSPFLFEEIDKYNNGTAQPNLSASSFMNFLFPLPPLAEQKRIVAKIDQLMASCDALEKLRDSRRQKRLDIHTAAITRLLDVQYPAEAEGSWAFLQEHFGELYGVKENVAELRKAILQLAVMGKLVAQDPKDQPASELLKEIEAEKKRLVKAGKIKERGRGSRGDAKARSDIKTEDVPYVVPKGWEWVRLGEITVKIGSGSTPRGGSRTYVDKGIPFIRSQNVYNDGLVLNDIACITDQIHESMSNTKVFSGDILLNITGASLGRSTLIPMNFQEANVSQHVTIIRILKNIDRKYIHKLILSPFCQRMIWERQVGMAREGLSKGVLELFEIPLPPLAEQKRIVAKIDQLMLLCNGLEQGIDVATRKQSAVLSVVLAQV